jgi:asparagine synthetase B (glutamine-hydrolysing)
MHKLERLLTESVRKSIEQNPNLPIALQFSGGCDSTAIFLCLENLGAVFDCHIYSFDQSADDLQSARIICKAHEKNLYEYQMSLEEVLANIELLKANYGFTGKVNLQCLCGHYKISRRLKHTLIFNASFADILYGCYKSVIMKCHSDPEMFDSERRRLLEKPNADATDYLTTLMAENGNIVAYPFGDKDVQGYLLGLKYQDLKSKRIFYQAFGDKLPAEARVRRRAQQIDSGVRDELASHKISYR